MRGLVHIKRRLDRHHHLTPQVDALLLRHVLDLLLVHHLLGCLVALGGRLLLLALVVTEDLGLDLLVQLLLLAEVGVELEVVGARAHVVLVRLVEVHLVRHHVVLVQQLQLLDDVGEVREVLLDDSEQAFDDVLRPHLQVALLQNRPEAVLHGEEGLLRQHRQRHARLLHEVDGHLHTVVRGLVEQQQEDVKAQLLVHDALVDRVRDELGRRHKHHLVVPLVTLLEEADHTCHQQVADLRQLGVDHGHQRRKHVGEGRGRSLCLHHSPAKQPHAPLQVLTERLLQDVPDVACVHLVHDTIERLLQCIPHQTLVLFAVTVHCLLHARHLVRRDVHSAAAALAVNLDHVAARCRHGRGRRHGSRLSAHCVCLPTTCLSMKYRYCSF
eukprot:Rhum_TRINITY_DN8922_c1_g1::Rhum_TRINITY_DN8922_c1_g1_i1::g.30703::m.30703